MFCTCGVTMIVVGDNIGTHDNLALVLNQIDFTFFTKMTETISFRNSKNCSFKTRPKVP